MKKVIVIGAGMGGLATAARLAKAGLSVEIFESGPSVGGKCRTEWFGDYAFDTGPTLLTLPAVFKDLFKKSGGRLEREVKLSPIDPAFKYFFADGTELTFPNLDLQKILREMDQTLGTRAGNDWHNIMQRAEAMWDASRNSFIEAEMPTRFALVKNKNLLRDLRVIAPWSSLSRIVRRYSDDSRIHKIVERYATYTGSDPRKAPAVLLTIAFMETTFGAWHVDGGIGNLATALERRCQELGVTIHLNTRVDRIVTNAGRVTGVLVGGTEILADAIVANADADLVYNHLIVGENSRARTERKKIKKNDKSLSGFSLYLSLDNSRVADPEALPKLAEHNVFFPQNYEAEFEDIFTSQIPVRDPAIYICAPHDSAMVRGEGADRKEAWSVLVNAPRHDPQNGFDWRTSAEEYARGLIAKLDSLGLRVSERLEVMEFRSPAELESTFNAPGGSIYGAATHGANSVFRRAKNRSPIEGLYLASGSAHPGGGLPMVTIGGELVAEAILDSDLGVGIPKNHH